MPTLRTLVSVIFSVVSHWMTLLEHVFHLQFCTCALSTPITNLAEAGLDCSVHLPHSLQGVGSTWPLVLYLRALSHFWLPWSASPSTPERARVEFSVHVVSPLFPIHVSCVVLNCSYANLVHRHGGEGRLGSRKHWAPPRFPSSREKEHFWIM